MSADANNESLRELYLRAIRLEGDAERESFLDQACENQPELRGHLEGLLAARRDDSAEELLEKAAAKMEIGRDFLGSDGFLGSSDRSPEATRDLQGRSDRHPTFRSEGRGALINIAEHPMIGHFKLLEEIGHGGMGTVYMAKQTEPVKRQVALKVITPGMDTREVIARFEAERQALAMMDHPNIAKVFDGGTTDGGRPYFVMELVRGVTITEFCKQQTLSLRDRLELFVDVCKAVQHAHQKGIIHRDLKPSNLLVTMHDHVPVIKVIDFGVAKALNQELTDKTLFTQFSQMIGTPLYMAPEQAQLSGLDVDTRSDIYSLGVVLYELLTGTTPFDRDTISKLGPDGFRKLLNEQDPERPSLRISTLKARNRTTVEDQRQLNSEDISKQLKRELDWIVMKALEKDRERRYETANAFAADVQRYLNDEPVEACPPSVAYRLTKYVKKHRGLVTTAGLLNAVMLFTAGLLFNERNRTLAAIVGEQQQRTVAEQQRAIADVQKEAAHRSTSDALRQRDIAMSKQYVAEIISSQLDLKRGYIQRLNRKLTSHLPLADQPDRCGWEWFWLPNDDLDKETILKLAASNAEINDGDSRATLVLGAANYRAGQYKKAAAILNNLVAKLERSGSVSGSSDLASAIYFLAMARHRLGHSFQAQRRLDEASEATGKQELTGALSWYRKLTLELLRKEAEALIWD